MTPAGITASYKEPWEGMRAFAVSLEGDVVRFRSNSQEFIFTQEASFLPKRKNSENLATNQELAALSVPPYSKEPENAQLICLSTFNCSLHRAPNARSLSPAIKTGEDYASAIFTAASAILMSSAVYRWCDMDCNDQCRATAGKSSGQ